MPRKPALPAEMKKAIRSALAPSVSALRRLARYKLEPSLSRRMQSLGERKEFLDKDEHDELLALVAFAQRRSIEIPEEVGRYDDNAIEALHLLQQLICLCHFPTMLSALAAA